MADFIGTSDNDTFDGTSDEDSFDMTQGGDDTVDGGNDDDLFIFGAALTADDAINGGNGIDTLSLDGDYSGGLIFAPNTLKSIELINLADGNSYDFTLSDGNLAEGSQLRIDASLLTGANSLHFDGGAETGGDFQVFGGTGDDVVIGGADEDSFRGAGGADRFKGGGAEDKATGDAGDDKLVGGRGSDELFGGDGDDRFIGGRGLDDLTGGEGADTFIYTNVLDSTNRQYDTIDRFVVGEDTIDLNVSVAALNPTLTTGSLSDGETYVSDFEAAINADVLGAGNAVVWIPDAGTDAGDVYVVIDANGVAGFQSAEDYIIELEDPHHLGDLDVTTFT